MEKSALGDPIVLPKFSEEDTRVLKKYYEINKKYREELNLELQEKLKHHPVFGPMMAQMGPEVQKAQQARSDAMQYAAIFEGKWEEYAKDLVTQGRMYARMNISYADWYELIAMAKMMMMPRIKRDFKNDLEGALDYLDGFAKFIDYAMYGIAVSYFQEKNEMIRSREERFAVVFKNSKDLIFLVDKEGKILAVNHQFNGDTIEALIGKPVADFQGKQHELTVANATRDAIEKKETAVFDTEVQHNGEVQYLSSSVSPVIGADGSVSEAVVISRDITEQKVAEIELQNLNATLESKVAQRTEELSAINKELESFTYSVSHDLRSPLRAINGFSEILKMELGDNLSEDAQDSLQEILKNTKRMGKLIDNLLEFSRLGKQNVTTAKVDMEELFNSVIEEQRKLLTHEVLFSVGSLPPTYGDRNMLKQVVINLISNAIKYSSKKPDPKIEIGSKKGELETTYFVKDNGAGFNMKYYDKLFGMFQRLHGSDEFEGNGVGLAIVKRIVTRHHGRVWAEGVEEQGATFYFSLPNNGTTIS